MPSECSVSTCHNNGRNTKGLDIKYYRFPNDKKLQKVWRNKCKRGDAFKVGSARICSAHFTENDFERDLQHELLGLKPRKKLKPHAVPSVFRPALPAATHATEGSTANLSSTSIHESDLDNATEARTVQSIPSNCQHNMQQVLKSREERYYARSVCKRALNRRKTISPLKRFADASTSTRHFEGISISEILLENEKMHWKIEEHAKYFKHNFRVQSGKINKLNNRYRMLQNKLRCQADSREKVNQVFTQVPAKCVIQGKKRTCWDKEDICNAITLRAMSKKSYLYQRRYMKFPLPCLSTLRHWTKTFRCPPGILHSVLELLKPRMASMSTLERLCVVSFDEMNVDTRICYDQEKDQILGPCKNLQVAMARGLSSKWIQPIFYNFDTPMSKSLLRQIIVELELIDIHVVACVSDCGAQNATVWNELNVNHLTPCFVNPHDDKRKVWVFADVPHLLKLLRNHFIDDGLRLPLCSKVIGLDVVKKLLPAENSELKICHKLTSAHLDVKGRDRMQVFYAAQLFSDHTAKALDKIIPSEPEAAMFFQLVNDCFDVLNSQIFCDENKKMKSAFGLFLEKQLHVLNEFHRICFLMRCRNKKALLPFQRGFLMTIAALKGLYEDVKSYGGTYIHTSHLNLDCLESFFARLHGLGQFNDNPLPTEVKNRIRLLILGINTENIPMSQSTNIVEESDHIISSYITTALFKNINTLVSVNELDEKELYDELMSLKDDAKNIEDLQGAQDVFDCPAEELIYLAGYIAYRGKNYDLSLGFPNSKLAVTLEGTHWIEPLSHRGLLVPTEKCLEMINAFELNFVLMHGNGLKKDNVMSGLSDILIEKFPDLHKAIIHIYVRTRTFIRIRFINQEYKKRMSGKTAAKKQK